jgi:peroxiredoxin Q/BCP
MLQPGDKIPGDITVLDAYGEPVRLADFAGRKLIIYFYPKDNTPGCTTEAIQFEGVRQELAALGWTVIGISADSCQSHTSFKIRYNLGFTLLSDPDKALIKAFGAYGEKKNYGRTYLGIIRSTFLVDETGQVIKVFPKVKASGHGEEVLNWIRENRA